MDANTRTKTKDEEHLVTRELGHESCWIRQKHTRVHFLIMSYATTFVLVLSNLSTIILEVLLGF